MERRGADVDDGFTLVELLVTILILGTLAGIVVFAVGGITDRGGSSSCAQDHRTITTAIEAYRAQNGNAAPASLTELTQGNKYLRAGDSLSATTKTGEGYVLTYAGGVLTDCPPALQAGGGGGAPGGGGGAPGGGAPAVASGLAISGPSNWVAGTAQSVTVRAVRADGSTDSDYNGGFTFGGSAWVVTPSVRASTPQGQQTLVDGEGSFAVMLKQAGSGLGLVVQSPGLQAATLQGLAIAPAQTTLAFVNANCGNLGPGQRTWKSAVNRGQDAYGNPARTEQLVSATITRASDGSSTTLIEAGETSSPVISWSLPPQTVSLTVTASATGHQPASCVMTH